MKRAAVGLCVLLAGAGLVQAEVGDVSYVACKPDLALEHRAISASHPAAFATAAEGCGTVSPQAVVATIRGGPLVVMVAIDSKTAGAKAPDIVRFDFSGEGTFNNDLVAPLEIVRYVPGQGQTYRFGPATFPLQWDGRALPVTVQGQYAKHNEGRYVTLALGAAVQADCLFGAKTHPVRIIDGNSNLRLGDEAKATDGGAAGGDTIAVDLGDGKFDSDKAVQRVLYGQYVLVDGVWYDVKLSGDGAKIEAKALDLKTGRLKIDHDEYGLTLAGDKHMLRPSGGREPIAVPAGRYRIIEYRQYAEDAVGGKGTIWCRPGSSGTEANTIEVLPEELTELKIGTPLVASAQARQSAGVVSFSLVLVDAAGLTVGDLRIPQKGRPPEPQIKIFDQAGKLVYSGKMQYG